MDSVPIGELCLMQCLQFIYIYDASIPFKPLYIYYGSIPFKSLYIYDESVPFFSSRLAELVSTASLSALLKRQPTEAYHWPELFR